MLATNKTLLGSSVGLHAECLSRDVSLVSGHGMQDIWRHFVHSDMKESVRVTLTRLDGLVVCLDPNTSSYGMLHSII